MLGDPRNCTDRSFNRTSSTFIEWSDATVIIGLREGPIGYFYCVFFCYARV